MKYFSMFSGIGGFELAIKKTIPHAECIGHSEIDKHAINTYEKHFPNHRNYGDATSIRPEELPDFDMLCAGFPCQAFSIAGKRKGFKDSRGNLFFEIVRILECKKPAVIVLENVKGLLSHKRGHTFRIIIQTLDGLGYHLEWLVLNSKNFKTSQNRERIFIVGYHRRKSRQEIFSLGKNLALLSQENPKGLELLYDGDYQSKRIYSISGVAPTIPTGKAGGNHIPFIAEIHTEADSIGD
jgi:DNA (cytosine-5)-methyltransferase 1